MRGKEDVEFLAVLVHRGHLSKGEAESLIPALRDGAELDALLERALSWTEAQIAKLRRTNGGAVPELPGYEIVGKAGHGGTAEVFRARELKTGRTMALKVLNPVSTRTTATRKAFIAEAKLLAKLDHPALVSGFGVARSGNTFFARMEYVDGKTLLEHLDAGQDFDEPTALRIVLEVAEVLQYIASEGVVHRDIKPGNIMLSSSGQVKLIDLGFAATQDATSTPTDSTVGTVAYLSPEQAQGGASADIRSDIYSLGVTLFHLVVGRLPFESSDDREVLRMQVMESLRSPELKGRGLSHHMQYFIEKMMAKDAEARYQTWDELIGDIRTQLEGRDSLDFERGARSKSRRGPGAVRR